MTITLPGAIAFAWQRELLDVNPIYFGEAPSSHFDVVLRKDVIDAMMEIIFRTPSWKADYPIMYEKLLTYNTHTGYDDAKLETTMLEIARNCSSWTNEFSGLSTEFYWLIAAIEKSISGPGWRILGIWRWFHFEEFHQCPMIETAELASIVQRDIANIESIVNKILWKKVISWWQLICTAEDGEFAVFTALDWLTPGEVYLSLQGKPIDTNPYS